MGSFDGWSQGEHLSPEYNGSYMHFSTTLFLRPGRYVSVLPLSISVLLTLSKHLPPLSGKSSVYVLKRYFRVVRYEIKFLVDGEWHLSPELPITGEGLTKNNLLIVE